MIASLSPKLYIGEEFVKLQLKFGYNNNAG